MPQAPPSCATFLRSMPFADHGKWPIGIRKKLLLSSNNPATALYQAKKAAQRPKKPPVLMRSPLTTPGAVSCKWPIARNKKAKSRVKKSKKNARDDFRVAISIIVVKIHQA